MNTILVLLRRNFIESRWPLGLCISAFFGLSWLTTWMAMRFERLIDQGEIGPASRRYGFLRLLGGPVMDYSTTALEVCWWNHPVIILTVLGWVMARGSAAVAGEIERGTIDVTLSRPISRPVYLTSQILFALLGLVLMIAALVGGNLFGSLLYSLKSPPSLLTLARPSLIVLGLGMAVFGYTLPFSTVDVVRWRPTLISSTITLAGLVSLSLASQFPDYRKILENLTVFQLYAPVTVALKVDPLAFNVALLTLIFALGSAVSYVLFARRDLPSNS